MPGSGIKTWAVDDRPREKLLQKGRSALSDAELLAILLGSGTSRHSAVDVARQLLLLADNQLEVLAGWDLNHYLKVEGIGQARAVTILAALELGRRRSFNQSEKYSISCAADVVRYMYARLQDAPVEQFWALFLKRNNSVINAVMISQGGVSGTVVDPKLIFKHALSELASAVILIHNHPSGNAKPSAADKKLTEKLKQAGDFLETPVLDHIIYTNQEYYSFAEEGLL